MWTTEHDQAFNTLKMRHITAPILTIFDPQRPTIVDCDASGVGLGAVLSQIVDGQERVVAFASRTLNQTEAKYSITKRELLAAIYSLKQFRQYILGVNFTLRTDHEPLRYLQSLKDPPAQMGRWLDRLQDYTFTVEHRPGSQHGNADGLSRQSNNLETEVKQTGQETYVTETYNNKAIRNITEKSTDTNITTTLTDIDWAHEQSNDTDIGPIYNAMMQSPNEPNRSAFVTHSTETKNLLEQWNCLTLINNILYRKWMNAHNEVKWLQLIVPYSLHESFISACHTGMTGGHLGPRKTIQQVQRRAYFTGWRAKTYRFCRQCKSCATYFRGKMKHQACMQPMATGNPMERMGIDLCGPFPESYDGKVHILTCTDYFSKWTESIPIADKQASTGAKALVDNIFSRFGCPWELVSDQGSEFDNKLIKTLCEKFHITK